MEASNDTARWAAIANALSSPAVKSQAAVWEVERRQMLDIVRQFWTAEERLFRAFAENPANSDSLSAIVVTSLEDMPEGFVGALIGVCCPELIDVETLATGPAITALFNLLVSGKEKEGLEADTSLISAELPPAAMRMLQLARANSLLNFLQAVALLYQHVDLSVPHIALGSA